MRGKYRARHFILHTPVTCVSRAEQARQNCPRVKTFSQDIHSRTTEGKLIWTGETFIEYLQDDDWV